MHAPTIGNRTDWFCISCFLLWFVWLCGDDDHNDEDEDEDDNDNDNDKW
jgi:hypothetical protein